MRTHFAQALQTNTWREPRSRRGEPGGGWGEEGERERAASRASRSGKEQTCLIQTVCNKNPRQREKVLLQPADLSGPQNPALVPVGPTQACVSLIGSTSAQSQQEAGGLSRRRVRLLWKSRLTPGAEGSGPSDLRWQPVCFPPAAALAHLRTLGVVESTPKHRVLPFKTNRRTFSVCGVFSVSAVHTHQLVLTLRHHGGGGGTHPARLASACLPLLDPKPRPWSLSPAKTLLTPLSTHSPRARGRATAPNGTVTSNRLVGDWRVLIM